MTRWCVVPVEATNDMKLVVARSIRDSMNRPNHTERAAMAHQASLTARPPEGDAAVRAVTEAADGIYNIAAWQGATNEDWEAAWRLLGEALAQARAAGLMEE